MTINPNLQIFFTVCISETTSRSRNKSQIIKSSDSKRNKIIIIKLKTDTHMTKSSKNSSVHEETKKEKKINCKLFKQIYTNASIIVETNSATVQSE